MTQPEYRKKGFVSTLEGYVFPKDQTAVEDLFGRYKDVFAHSSSQLGRTSLAEHEINVGTTSL